jgi:3-oxoacyl-[acyl-carrier-protein] synthase-3
MKAGGSVLPASLRTVRNRLHYVYQEGRQVFKHAVVQMAAISEALMNKHRLTPDDIAFFVPHQANRRIIEAAAQRLGLPLEKVMINIDRYGNTTSATLPLCLYDYESQLKKGDNLILATFGGGFTWGALWLRWAY